MIALMYHSIVARDTVLPPDRETGADLYDSKINSLPITAVNCKNGKYDAIVYFDGSDYDKTEIKEVIASLNKANGRIKTHILASTGWYKCPNFTFLVDTSLEKSKNIEALFAQIRKTKSEEE